MMDNDTLSVDELVHLYRQRYRRSLLYGKWLAETEQEKQLRELAECYHTACEAYDRDVCRGVSPRTGEAIPLTGDELGLVDRHAFEVRTKVMRMGAEQGLSEEQVIEAIKRYAR